MLVGQVNQRLHKPFDTVKVRLQTQSSINPIYSGVGDCVKKTVSEEGLLGLYKVCSHLTKGTLTPLMGAGVCVAIQFSAMETAKRFFAKSGPAQPLSPLQLYACGAFSGICNSVISGPMEHVRTRLQVQTATDKLYSGPGDFLKKGHFHSYSRYLISNSNSFFAIWCSWRV